MEKTPAILLLQDGTVFNGFAAGKIGTTTGELCFNTGMTGYQEVFSDPSYFGQILVATNAHIGNYGTHVYEVESDSVKIAGLVCKNFTWNYSRPMATTSIQDYFLAEQIVGISNVDTRSIVRHIRNKGAMNAIISSEIFDLNELKAQLQKVPSMEGLELASKVSTTSPYQLGSPNSQYRVAVLDFGVKKNILNCFLERDCFLQVFPGNTPISELRKWNPDGYFLSNGPGDPGAMEYAVETVRHILSENKPLFGICLGHQILARAIGISTFKMHHGHRGINHPVKNLITGHCEITSQNHGFGVSQESMEQFSDKVEITHINLNDQTVEGLRVVKRNAFSVQYHPEASPGPHDARYLFDDYLKMLALSRKPEKEITKYK
jgi:carbamoyl-phosphate synthase small subunit